MPTPASGQEGTLVSDDWVDRVIEALGLEASAVDEDLILDLARDVAHSVERKAAPVTTFLVGLAAARAGGDRAAVERAASAVRELAGSFGKEGSA